MAERLVLSAGGPSRLARTEGVLRAGREGEPTPLVLESPTGGRGPVILLPPHRVHAGGYLVGDEQGNGLIRDGQHVVLVGGGTTGDDPRYPAFLAAQVLVVEDD